MAENIMRVLENVLCLIASCLDEMEIQSPGKEQNLQGKKLIKR